MDNAEHTCHLKISTTSAFCDSAKIELDGKPLKGATALKLNMSANEFTSVVIDLCPIVSFDGPISTTLRTTIDGKRYLLVPDETPW